MGSIVTLYAPGWITRLPGDPCCRPGRGGTVFPGISAPENLSSQGLGAFAESFPVLGLSLLFTVEEPGKDTRFAAGNLYHTMEEKHISGNDPALFIEHHRHASHDTFTL